jgi:bacillopeptidase F
VTAIVAVLLAATGGSGAAAAEIGPELAAILESASPGDRVAVIVELEDRFDLASVTSLVTKARRRNLVSGLRAQAARSEAPVRFFLESRGVTNSRSLWLIGSLAVRAPVEAVVELAGRPDVAEIRLDRMLSLPPPSPKVAADAGWNLEIIGAHDLWAAGIDGSGIVVAVVDSGVDVAHQDLGSRWRGGDGSWFDPHGEHPTAPYDADGHGTQAAGLVVGGDATGTAMGVAPGAEWIAGKLFDDSGQSTSSTTHEIFQWLLDPDGDPDTDDAPDVVNNSWGFRDNPGECVDEFAVDIQVLRAAGIAVVFSAGNGGPNANTSISPANNAGAFSVGGSDGADEVMNGSSRGPSACGGGTFPALVAPGDGVRTADLTLGGIFPVATTEVLGSSFAAPHVTGAMALLLSAHPQATAEQLEQALLAGAEDLGPDGPDNDSGPGRLDVVKAEAELAALVGSGGNASVFTDETAFLAAVGNGPKLTEGFEDDAVWDIARQPETVPSVTSRGVTWTSNHPGNDVTTGSGAARTGSWGFYSFPHGDPTATQPLDPTMDGFTGNSSAPLTAVGGWFVGTSGSRLSLILDGDDANPIDLGPVDVFHGFLGVVVDGTFTTFEFRETEGKVEDQKFIFLDDVTMALSGGGGNRPPEGTILQPTGPLTVALGETVFFEGTASDPDGDAVTVLWDFGDGSTSTASTPGDHVYSATGGYTVTFTATDAHGVADPTPDTRVVTVIDEPPAGPTGVVAGVANVPGALGSDWHTDLYLHNASLGDISLDLTFSPADGTAGAPVSMTVLPDQTAALDDVVFSVFGIEGSGAVNWTITAGDPAGLIVSANTYNRVDADRRYGQQIPGIRWGEIAGAGSSVWVPALAGPYRTNLGFATDQDCTRVVIRGYDRFGDRVAERVLYVQPLTWVQLNRVFRFVFPDLIDDPDGVALADSIHRFEVVGSNGRVAAYTSIIDNRTNDGSYMTAQVPADGERTAWLPGAARTSGANDSRWRSDLILMHVGAEDATTSMDFFASGGASGTAGVALAAGESVVEEDILHSIFGLNQSAVGSLMTISPAAADGLTWMRTYTEEPVTGGDFQTYGQAIGPRDHGSMITTAVSGRVAGFSHDAGSRSNLILQNTRAVDGEFQATTVRVEVLAADGQTLRQQMYALDPGEYRQHNRFLDDYGIADLAGGTIRIVVTSSAVPGETGGVDAMVSEVNGNTVDGTNDGRLIRAEVKR